VDYDEADTVTLITHAVIRLFLNFFHEHLPVRILMESMYLFGFASRFNHRIFPKETSASKATASSCRPTLGDRSHRPAG
jgi:hypothetical protein